MKRKLPTTAAVAAACLLSGPSSASWDMTCGYSVPSCVTYDLQPRSVDADNNCNHPIALEITVTDGLIDTGHMVMRSLHGMTIGPPFDNPGSEEPASYSEVFCCTGEYMGRSYNCRDTTGAVKGE